MKNNKKTKKYYKCLRCKEVQIYENKKPLPDNVVRLELSECIYCNQPHGVNIFSNYVFGSAL